MDKALFSYEIGLDTWQVAVLAGVALAIFIVWLSATLPGGRLELTRRQAFLLAIPGVNVVAFIAFGLTARYRAAVKADEEALQQIKRLLADDAGPRPSAKT